MIYNDCIRPEEAHLMGVYVDLVVHDVLYTKQTQLSKPCSKFETKVEFHKTLDPDLSTEKTTNGHLKFAAFNLFKHYSTKYRFWYEGITHKSVIED